MPIDLFDNQFGLNIGPWEDRQLVESLERLTRIGYNGVEVTNNTFRRYSDRISVLKEIISDVGIDVASYVIKLDFGAQKSDASLLDRFQGLANFIRAIRGKYIVVEQGMRPEWNGNLEEQLLHFERVVTDFSSICNDSGVELIFHPTPDSFIRSPEILDRTVELIYPLGTRICLDVCDFLTMGVHPIQFMKKYFDAIRIIHLNDMKLNRGKKAHSFLLPERTLVGQGKVDIKSIWTYLQASEYKGWVIVECPRDTLLSTGVDRTTQYLTKNMEVFLTNLLDQE